MSKLLVSLLFAVCLCLAFTSGSSIYRDRTEDKDFMDGRQNDEWIAMSTLDDESEDESDDQERDNLMTRFIDGRKTKVNTAREYWNEAEGDASQENDSSDESDAQKESSLLPRGILDKVKTSVTNAGNKAQGYVDTAKAKVGEVKEKVSKIKVPELRKRNTDNERYMGILGVREDDIFNYLKKWQGDASQENDSSDESDGQKESSLLPRGILDKVKTSVTNAGNKAQGYVDTAKAKVGEVKDKVSKIKVPELRKRHMDKLQHVMKRYMSTLGVNEDDIFNLLKKRQEYRNPAQKSDAFSK